MRFLTSWQSRCQVLEPQQKPQNASATVQVLLLQRQRVDRTAITFAENNNEMKEADKSTSNTRNTNSTTVQKDIVQE